MANLKIYLTNLGKYNEGELVGEWVDLPVSNEELLEVFKRIGISYSPDPETGSIYEEYFITDYESDIPGLSVGEYDSISSLNEIAEAIEDLDDWDLTIFKNAVEAGFFDADNIENFDPSRFILYSDVYTPQDLGYALVEQYGDIEDVPSEMLEQCFDYEAFGRDCRFEWDPYSWLDGYSEEELEEQYGTTDVSDVSIYDYCDVGDGDDKGVGEYFVDNIYGDISELGRDTLETYFDYEGYAYYTVINAGVGEFTEDGFIEDTER